MLKDYLFSINMSVYKLAKESGVPYTTVLELTKNKTNVNKATVGTVIKLADVLNMNVDQFINVCSEKRVSFQEFRSTVCHSLKSKGDKKFMVDLLTDDSIGHYFAYGWYEESLYLLALLDYLKDNYGITSKDPYDDLRNEKLENISYPRDVLMIDEINGNDDMKNYALKNSIKEFLKYNIVECDIRNVI